MKRMAIIYYDQDGDLRLSQDRQVAFLSGSGYGLISSRATPNTPEQAS
jgi:hypothetical protein